MNTSGMYQQFKQQALNQGDKTAIIFEQQTISYRRLLELCDTIASQLEQRIDRDQPPHVALHLKNCIEQAACAFAIARQGMVAIPVNTTLKAEQLVQSCLATDVQLIVTSSHQLKQVSQALAAHEHYTPVLLTADELTTDTAHIISEPIVDIDAAFIITLSSGSTGEPKPIVLSQRVKQLRSQQSVGLFDVTSDDVILCASPFFHSLGQRLTFLPLLHGGTLVLLDGFTPAKWINATRDHGVTFTIPVSCHLHALQEPLLNNSQDIKTLRGLVSSSADIDPQLKHLLLETLNCQFHEMYGASEVATASNLAPQAPKSKEKSVGLPCPGVDIKILDDQQQEVTQGECGEIAVNSPLMFSGYYQKPELTAAAKNGNYFLTGDLGYLDDEGYLYFVSRKKDIIISGGINIYPADIESVIKQHPQIDDCSVIAIQDSYLGEAVYAVCATRTQDHQTLERELRTSLGQHLASFQQPLGYDFIPALPLTASGKIDKQGLRKDYNNRGLDLTATMRRLLNINTDIKQRQD